jgi:hypothetical protein
MIKTGWGVCLPETACMQNNLQQLQTLVPGLLINLDKMKASDWVGRWINLC